VFLGQLVENVENAMVPTTLLLGLGIDLGQSTPNPQMPIPDH